MTTAPITNSVVGTWDTSSIQKADYYTIRVTVDNTTYTSQAFTLVYLEPDLLSANWPQWLDSAPGLYSGIVPATDASGNVRLALATPHWAGWPVPGKFRTFSADGSSQTAANLLYGASWFRPAAADLTGKTGQEVAFGEPPWLDIFGLDNTYEQLSSGNFQFAQPVLDDLDGDTELETLAMGLDPGTTNDYLYAWRRDGQQLNSNFPIQIADQNLSVRYFTSQRVLVGDLYGNGNKEFLAVGGPTDSTSTLLLFGSDGSPKPWAAPLFDGFPASIVLADLDHNGQLETIVAVASQSSGVTSTLHVLQPDGSERPGWPLTIPNLSPLAGVVVGDLARDGHEEIVVPTFNQLFALNADGTSYASVWPQQRYGFGSAVLADLDGDGYPEILTTVLYGLNSLSAPLPTSYGASGSIVISTATPATLPQAEVRSDGSRAIHIESDPSAQAYPGQLYYYEPQLVALRRDGTIARSWKLLGANGNQPNDLPQPVVGDFNQDGITDITVSYMTVEGGGINGYMTEGVVTVLSTGAPFHPAVNDWPMLNHDPRNTSVRDRRTPAPAFSPAGGTYDSAQVVTLSDTATGASIYYAADGSTPTTASTLYTGPITVSTSNTTIKAIAVASGLNPSSVVSQTYVINGSAISSVQVDSSENPSLSGQSVTFTATVSPKSATGLVTFSDGGTTLGTSTLSGGLASFITPALAPGSHNITASYSGDNNFRSSSAALTGNPQVVQKGDSTVTLVSSLNPSRIGQLVTFTATVSPVAPALAAPGGKVTFFDTGVVIGEGTLIGGIATVDVWDLAAGSHTITASYGGDGNYNGSTGSMAGNPQVVNKTNSTLAVVASQNPSVAGQAVTFTATASGPSWPWFAPTGTITFLDGGIAVGTTTLSEGLASFTTSALSAGSHNISASYAGDGNYTGSTASLSNPQVVNSGSSILLTSSPNPSSAGRGVSFTATVAAVAPATGMPTGTVTILDGGLAITTATLAGGVAHFDIVMAAGSHNISASYAGDANFNSSTSSLAGNPQIVRGSSSITMVSSPNPSTYGQAVIFTATVSPATATGAVTYFDGGTAIGTATLISGVAIFTTSALAVGGHTITASYGGDMIYTGSSGSLSIPQTVNKGSSALALVSSLNPSVAGHAVTFTATVSALAPAAGTPTGIVTFRDGATSIGTAAPTSGVAIFTTSAFATGSHTITASYGGDINFKSSSGSLTGNPLVVTKGSTTLAVISSANPSRAGQAVAFTATISPVSITGSITFRDGTNTLGTVTMSSGVARIVTSTLTLGSHTITASYAGNSQYYASTASLTGNPQVVNQGDSSVAVVSSVNPSIVGQPVKFTARVSAVAPATGTPTGTVTFLNADTGAVMGTATLSGGVAYYNASALTVGTHNIAVSYAGDRRFTASTGSLVQAVHLDSSSVSVTSSLNSSVIGQAVKFTIAVRAVSPATGAPTGTVTLFDNGNAIGSAPLTSGIAYITTNTLAVGSHAMSASYSGDSKFTGSTGRMSTSQTVKQGSTSMTLKSSQNPSSIGQVVSFTATVTAVWPATGTPAGTVIFLDGTNAIGSGTLSGGVARFTTSALASGSHTITASYDGDAKFSIKTVSMTGNPQLVK